MMSVTIEPAIFRLPNGTHILIHRNLEATSTGLTPDTPLVVLQSDIPAPVIQGGDNWDGTGLLFPDMQENNLEHTELVPDNDSVDVLGKVVISYKCNFCPYLAEEKEELLHHFSWNHGEGRHLMDPNKPNASLKIQQAFLDSFKSEDEVTPLDVPEPCTKEVYQCGECEGVFPTFDDCKQHMFSEHDLVVAETEIIDTKTPKRKDPSHRLQKSKSTSNAQSTESRLKCLVRGCQFVKFSNAESLAIHTQCHTGDSKEFKCIHCPEMFERWRACTLHLWKAHELDAGLLSCPICLVYKTITSVKLENHIKVHREDRPYICTHYGCGKSFKQPSQLRNHRVLHIDRKTGKVPRWYSTQKCDICDKNFADSKCLKKHIQAVHSKIRPYVCNVCGHASARKAMLQMHSRQHTGEKPYHCDICSYRTGDHNSLRRHKMRHTGDRPYQCPHCPYASIQSNSYKNHLQSKHPGKNGAFSCDECDFRTVNEEAYITHKKDHLNGLIPSSTRVKYFPENEVAADLICDCFGGTSGGTWKTNVTGSTTSADGITQTITIQLPGAEDHKPDVEDDESQCFYTLQLDKGKLGEEEEEDPIDTGGITIPADPDTTY